MKIRFFATVTAVAAGILSLGGGAAWADGSWTAAELLDPEQSILSPVEFSPFPFTRLAPDGGLSFDLGGSEQQKLQLQLAEPLAVGTALSAHTFASGVTETRIGGSLGWLANENLGLSVSTSTSRLDHSFHALGSIHCEDGVLARDSFTASNCYFVDQSGASRRNTLSIGAQYTPTEHSRAGINLFRQQAYVGNGVRDYTAQRLMPELVPGSLSPSLLRPFAGQAVDDGDSEITGVDLEFELGVSTNRAGDISLGLQLTRILDANVDGLYANGAGFQNWSLSNPADSARVSFDWQKGAFSGGVESYYRAPIEFMNRRGLDSSTTFDVHFTWRTPWNANLSVGASNLLNSGADDNAASDNARIDPFESVYGRIPYVRYEQDL